LALSIKNIQNSNNQHQHNTLRKIIFRIARFSKTVFGIMTLGIATFGKIAPRFMTFRITTLSITTAY
jgi:hypothetical protein